MVLTEEARPSSGIDVGDAIRLASWGSGGTDAAVNEGLRPTVEPVRMRVVGIGRFKSDLAPPDSGDLSSVPGQRWFRHERGGRRSASPDCDLRRRAGAPAARWPRWVDRLTEDLFSVARPLLHDRASRHDLRRRPNHGAGHRHGRRAVLGFALIAGVAAAGFVGLILVRQAPARAARHTGAPFARDVAETSSSAAGAGRTVIAVPASVLAVVLTFATSPLTPIGVARRAEPDPGFFVDAPVVAALTLAVLVGVLAIAGAVPLIGQTERKIRPPLRTAAAVTGNLGPAARVGLTLARGSWPRTAAVVTGAALAALVASSMLVTSLDRVIDEPPRYGAWWDLTMGDYSDPSTIAQGAEIVAEDPDVEAIAGLYDQTDVAVADGHPIDLVAYVPYQGSPEPVLTRGRAPVDTDEIALAHDTLREGSTRTSAISSSHLLSKVPPEARPVTLTITGEFVNNNRSNRPAAPNRSRQASEHRRRGAE